MGTAMRVVVIDPAYGHPSGHHHTVNITLAKNLIAAGLEVVAAGSAELSAKTIEEDEKFGLTSLPWFTIPRYPANAENLPLSGYEDLTAAFGAQVLSLFSEGVVRRNNCCLLHTGFAFHFHGLARALWKLPARIKGRWVVLTMFAPGGLLPHGRNASWFLEDARLLLRYRLALKLLSSAAQRSEVEVTLASPTRAYQLSYQQFWPGRVALHPAVNYRRSDSRHIASAQAPFTVLLYLGCPKGDKGIEFALQLGITAAKRLPKFHLLFHFNSSFHGAGRYEAPIETLQRAGAKHANVTVVGGDLAAQQYDALIDRSDVICLLYDPAHYRIKTSGILWDGLRCDHLRWLVTEGSWMQAELTELGMAHDTVPFGDVQRALRCLKQQRRRWRGRNSSVSSEPRDYKQQICRPLAEWLLEELSR